MDIAVARQPGEAELWEEGSQRNGPCRTAVCQRKDYLLATDGVLVGWPAAENLARVLARHGERGPGDSSVVYRAAISGGALLLVLLVVASGMALWAAEGRDEQSMLASIGASPRALTRTTAWRAALLTATGVVITVPLGYGTVWAVTVTDHADGRDSSAPFPWIVAIATLLAVPTLVTGASLGGGTLGQQCGRPRFDIVD